MGTDTDLERALDSWMTIGPARAGDGVLTSLADRIARERQRPGWRVRWGWERLHLVAAPTAVAAAVVIVAVAIVMLPAVTRPWLGAPTEPASTSTPLPTDSPQPTATAAQSGSPDVVQHTCGNGAPTCSGPVEAGDHRSFVFEPSFSYSLPSQWVNPIDIHGFFEIYPEAVVGTATHVEMWSNPSTAVQNRSCGPARAGGRGGVSDWVEFLTTHPELRTSTPVPVTVGGASGQMLDIRLPGDHSSDCAVVFIWSHDPDQPARFGLAPPQQSLRLMVLDVRGSTVLMGVYSGGRDPDQAMTNVRPFITSLRFDGSQS